MVCLKLSILFNNYSISDDLVFCPNYATKPALELYIPSGHDPRLQRLISLIVNQPDQSLLLEQLANQVGASVRTIERLFKAETGLTFRQWRSRFRLMSSLDKISQGYNTTLVAHELGYSSVSSFLSSFKKLFGCTPKEYAQR